MAYLHMVYDQMYEEHDHHHDQMTRHEEHRVYVQLSQYEEYIIHDHLHLSFYHGMYEERDLHHDQMTHHEEYRVCVLMIMSDRII